ncbi:hypothetical protein L2E82_34358 [Cichorium intybus]|uniref:Uncharacterized protein n=1 Tax=Cichorium intybus TaxID=13427 RepID=A0ACB9BLZ1_CICIN|nr:hypothetical protein L2E82_34358 [Cichorium intybus]
MDPVCTTKSIKASILGIGDSEEDLALKHQLEYQVQRKRIRQLNKMREGLLPALLGCCNDRAKQLHASPGRLLTTLICEYLDWAQLRHTLKVYFPECNLQKDVWKTELRDFNNNNGYDINQNGDSGLLLLDVLEGFLKFENQSQGRDKVPVPMHLTEEEKGLRIPGTKKMNRIGDTKMTILQRMLVTLPLL